MPADLPEPDEIPDDLVRLYREVFLCRRKRWTEPSQESQRELLRSSRLIDAHPYWRSLPDADAMARVHRVLQQASPYPRVES